MRKERQPKKALVILFTVMLSSYLASELILYLYTHYIGEESINNVTYIVVLFAIAIPVYTLGHLREHFMGDND